MQISRLELQENNFSGNLPGSWAGLTQASHKSKVGSQISVCLNAVAINATMVVFGLSTSTGLCESYS